MATKKQKRLAGEARQKANAEETRRTGLIALQRDRERRANAQLHAKREAEREEARLEAILAEKRALERQQADNQFNMARVFAAISEGFNQPATRSGKI